eukprot:755698-Hanusia_phi.AAC.6
MALSSWCCQIADGLPGCDVSVLMGANVADEVARGDFCEATIGYSSRGNAEILKMLFEQPTFQLRLIPDCVGVEMYGTLKNVIALGAGFVDGLGSYQIALKRREVVLRCGQVWNEHQGRNHAHWYARDAEIRRDVLPGLDGKLARNVPETPDSISTSERHHPGIVRGCGSDHNMLRWKESQ